MRPIDLQNIAASTIGHYDAHAESYWHGTREHDVSQNISALLGAIEGEPPFKILDLGCGPGRDLISFKRLGHHAIGLDGSEKFVVMARSHSGCEVWQQDLHSLALPSAMFDGVFANAVLFHVATIALPDVLAAIWQCLKPRGVLFSSNPRGQDQAGFNGARYGAYHTLATWRRYLEAANFSEVTHYYRPSDAPPEQQHWLASVWRKVG